MKVPQEIEQLIDQWLDKTIEEDGMEQLNAWIKESREHADHFAQRSHLHSRLFDWAKGKDPRIVELPHKFQWVRATLGLAAAIVGLLLVGNWILQPEAGSPVATMTASIESDLLYQGKSQKTSDTTIRTGKFQLKSGVSSFRFENGVEVVVEAPAAFEIESNLKMSLTRGKLSANVPPEGIGFTVETPTAEVVDYGTEFAVEVGGDLSSEVHVFEGEVDVTPLVGSEEEPVHLKTNHATRIEHQSSVPIGIKVDHDRFLRTLKEPKFQFSGSVRALKPLVYYRMGPKTFNGEKGIEVILNNASQSFIAAGKIGASLRLGGPAAESFALAEEYPVSDTGKLSGVCWIYAESRPRKASIASNMSRKAEGQFSWFLQGDSGFVQIRAKTQEGNIVRVHEKQSLPIGVWQMVAFTADGETLRLYRNGQEVASTPCGPILKVDHAPLAIGAHLTKSLSDANQFWHGRIDEFSLFDKALSADQIQTLFEHAQRKRSQSETL